MPADVGGAGSVQRSFGASPDTGTTTTAAPVATWTLLTAYVVDPSAGGTSKVINGGNLYQCRTNGTSASIGGPTGTGTNITDGTAHWTYLGVAPATNTTAGSQVLGIDARGDQSTVPSTIDPTDNDTGTFTSIINTAYSGFPTSFAGVWRRSTGANNKTNYATLLTWGGSGGSGDDTTNLWAELRNVAVGAPHASSQVERANATAGVVSGATVTLSVPCLLFSVWAGNGNLLTVGTSHTAIPLNGSQIIPGATCLMSISANGYTQMAVAWRRVGPGTYTEQWNTGSGSSEGAQILTVAFADTSTIPVEDEVPSSVPDPSYSWGRRVSGLGVIAQMAIAACAQQDEQPPPAASIVDEDAAVDQRVSWPTPARQTQILSVDDDLAVVAATFIDDDGPADFRPLRTAWRSYDQVGDDELAIVPPDDETQPDCIGPHQPWRITADVEDDLLAVAPFDEDPVDTQVGARSWLRIQPDLEDDLPGVPYLDDEAPTVQPIQWPCRLPYRADLEDDTPGILWLDDDSPLVAATWPLWHVPLVGADQDEIAVAPDTDEDPQIQIVAPSWRLRPVADLEDDLPGVPSPDEEIATVEAPRVVARVPQVFAQDDEIPPAIVASIVDDEQPCVTSSVGVPRAVQALAAEDEIPTALTPTLALDDGDDVAQSRAVPAWRLAGHMAEDELPPSLLDEEQQAAGTVQLQRWTIVAATEDEIAPVLAFEDDSTSDPRQRTSPWVLRDQPIDEDLPSGVALEDEPWTLQQVASAPWLVRVDAPDDEVSSYVLPPPLVEDEWHVQPRWVGVWSTRGTPPDDDAIVPDTGPLPHHVRIPGISPDPEVLVGDPLPPEEILMGSSLPP